MKTKQNIFKRFLMGILTLMLVFTAGPYLPVQDNVSVAQAAQVKLNAKKVTLQKGKKKTLKLKDATGKITWKSSKKSVAAVSKKGVVTAKKPGKVTITATNKGKKYKCTVTVTAGGGSGKSSKASGSGGTVYWVPSGAVYHVSRNCPTLSRSRTVYSGSVAQSGKSRACKVCS